MSEPGITGAMMAGAFEIERLETELERAYRAISGLYGLVKEAGKQDAPLVSYHKLTIAAARRFIKDGSLDGADYFDGKPVEVLHQAMTD